MDTSLGITPVALEALMQIKENMQIMETSEGFRQAALSDPYQ